MVSCWFRSDEHLILLGESEKVLGHDKSRNEAKQVKNNGCEVDPIGQFIQIIHIRMHEEVLQYSKR
jgi:hypothetical protein